MTTQRNPDAVFAAWLGEGPVELPPVTRRAIVAALPITKQVGRGLVARWRFPMLQRQAGVLVLLGLMAALIVVAALLVGGGTPPNPSPNSTAMPTAAATSPASSAPSTAPSPASMAPFGYAGGGTIQYTNHDATGSDVVWVIDPSGANPTRIAAGGCCGLFSPDGTQLAIALPGVKPAGTTRDPSLLGIEVLDSPAGHVAFVVPTECVSCTLLNLNYAPDAWSPDGRLIAYDIWSDTDANQGGMGIGDRDSAAGAWNSDVLRVTGAHPDIPLAFSPDSSMLLFLRTERTAGPSTFGSLFLLSLSDGATRQLSPPGTSIQTNGLIQSPASWAPDGRSIVFAGKDGATSRSSIFAVDIATGSDVRTLVADAAATTSARFSPDGSLIVFDRQAGAGPRHDLYVIKPDGNDPTNLTAAFEPGVCCGQWSPDGRAVVVLGTASDETRNNLFVVATDGSGIWQVTNDENVYTAVTWGPGFR